ncbi:MAG: hypothetical protein AAFZ15_28990 [Bacteroidota bacterium]
MKLVNYLSRQTAEDMETGECNIVRSDQLYGSGRPTNPVINFGQIKGRIVQGIRNGKTA